MKDKVIVITGASKGLGERIARSLSSLGAKLVLSARDEQALKKVSDDTGSTFVVADVTDESAVQKIAAEAVSKHGRIDIWINNAGIWPAPSLVEDSDMKRMHEVLEVNLFGLAYGCRAAVKQMKKQGFGTIVNILSTASISARPTQTTYAASKHAAKGYSDSLREEVKENGIMVIGICPGGIKTELFGKNKPAEFDQFMTPEYVTEKIIANLLKETPDPELVLRRPGQ
jgi:short-subunit dehydrogenase